MTWWKRLLRKVSMTDREMLVDKRRDDYGTLRITENGEGYRFLYFGEQTEQSCVFMADPPGWNMTTPGQCCWVPSGLAATLI